MECSVRKESRKKDLSLKSEYTKQEESIKPQKLELLRKVIDS